MFLKSGPISVRYVLKNKVTAIVGHFSLKGKRADKNGSNGGMQPCYRVFQPIFNHLFVSHLSFP